MRKRACVIVLGGLSAAAVLAGCNLIGAGIYLVEGPATIDARYELPKERPTIVFVDDRGNRLPRRVLRQSIAETAQSALLNKGVVKDAIDTRAVLAAAARETAAEPMDMVSLAKAAQAEILIYVTVDSFTLSPDGSTYSPQAAVRVKVVDATKDEPRLWPPEYEGFPMTVTMSERAGDLPRSPAELLRAQDAFAAVLGESIAELFYEHPAKKPVSAR